MIYQHLFDRVPTPATVRAGLIGAGQFGTPIVTQAPLIPRLDVPVGITITADMIAHPVDSALWSLRRQQDTHFETGMQKPKGEK